MKNHKKHIIRFLYFLFILSAILQGCIEDVKNVNLPTIEQKLVVSSFITPGDSIRVKISKSTPIYYNQELTSWDDYYEPLTDATVFLTNVETGISKEIPYNSEKEFYLLTHSDFQFESGQTLELTASAPGLKEVSASTFIPYNTPEIHSLTIDTVYSESYDYEDGYNYEYHDIVITGYIKDIPNVNNYYSIGASVIQNYYDQWEDTTITHHYYQGADMLTDNGYDGEDIPFKAYVYLSGQSTFTLSFFQTDEHYYRYHKSFYNWDSGNPFSEPLPMYSNVEGGLGIFASYNLFYVYNP